MSRWLIHASDTSSGPPSPRQGCRYWMPSLPQGGCGYCSSSLAAVHPATRYRTTLITVLWKKCLLIHFPSGPPAHFRTYLQPQFSFRPSSDLHSHSSYSWYQSPPWLETQLPTMPTPSRICLIACPVAHLLCSPGPNRWSCWLPHPSVTLNSQTLTPLDRLAVLGFCPSYPGPPWLRP